MRRPKLCYALCLFLSTAAIARESDLEADKTMTPDQIRFQVSKRLDGDQEADLAETLLAQSREAAQTLYALWAGANEEHASTALRILTDLEEQAAFPITQDIAELEPTERTQAIQIAIQAELGLRQQVLVALDAMLDDRRPLPARRRLAPTETTTPERRVCDEDYLMMRELIHFGEDELEVMVAEDAFRNLPEDERDRAISEARETGVWNRLVLGDPGL